MRDEGNDTNRTAGGPANGDLALATEENAASADETLRVRGVIETTMCCSDLDAAEEFYTRVLGLEVFAEDSGRHLFFRCGNGMLLLFNPDDTTKRVTMVGDAQMPLHGTTGAGHIAFRAPDADIDRWKERLGEHGVEIESEVIWPEGGRSIFFRDPAGNSLEFTTPVTWGLPDDS